MKVCASLHASSKEQELKTPVMSKGKDLGKRPVTVTPEPTLAVQNTRNTET